jgi:hypothetical protein
LSGRAISKMCKYHDYPECHTPKRIVEVIRGFCVFGYREYNKNLLCILVEAYKTIYGINTTVPKITHEKCSI